MMLRFLTFTLCDATFSINIVGIYKSANIKTLFFHLLYVDDQDVDGGGDCVHTLLLPTQHWLGRAKFVYIFIFYIYFQSPPYIYLFGRPGGRNWASPKKI
jgi:hypothetical protein